MDNMLRYLQMWFSYVNILCILSFLFVCNVFFINLVLYCFNDIVVGVVYDIILLVDVYYL